MTTLNDEQVTTVEPVKKKGRFFRTLGKIGRVILKVGATVAPLIKNSGLWGVGIQAADKAVDQLEHKKEKDDGK